MKVQRKIGSNIEAFQWFPSSTLPMVAEMRDCDERPTGMVVTDTGLMRVRPGDWIIILGEKLWVCEKDLFDTLYAVA